MTGEQTLRLQCLELAAKLGASGAAAVDLAALLYAFIMDEKAKA